MNPEDFQTDGQYLLPLPLKRINFPGCSASWRRFVLFEIEMIQENVVGSNQRGIDKESESRYFNIIN
jgi:hypothetical protein